MNQLSRELERVYGFSTDDIGKHCINYLASLNQAILEKQEYNKRNCRVKCQCEFTGRVETFQGTSCPTKKCAPHLKGIRYWSMDGGWDEIETYCR